MVTFVDVEEARERIKEQIYLSPLPYSETISRMTGNRVFFKLENLQMTGSFKERGALNRLLTLSAEERNRGVIAASAGNHGMALAFHSHRLDIAATIVMPVFAPLIKVSRVRQYGAQTVLCGDDYDSALSRSPAAEPGKKPHLRLGIQRSMDRRRPGYHRSRVARTEPGSRCRHCSGGRRRPDRRHRPGFEDIESQNQNHRRPVRSRAVDEKPLWPMARRFGCRRRRPSPTASLYAASATRRSPWSKSSSMRSSLSAKARSPMRCCCSWKSKRPSPKAPPRCRWRR